VTPSIVATIRANAPLVGGRFESGPMHVALVAVFAAGFLALAWAMRRTRLAAPARFGVLFLYATAFIALAGYWFHFPCCRNRSAITSRWIWLSGCCGAGRRARLRSIATAHALIVVGALALAAAPIWIYQLHRARGMEQSIDIQTTAEYRVSRWLGEHLPGGGSSRRNHRFLDERL